MGSEMLDLVDSKAIWIPSKLQVKSRNEDADRFSLNKTHVMVSCVCKTVLIQSMVFRYDEGS